MSVPRLNRRLVLEAPVQTPDGAGGFSNGWSALGTVWGEITARTGRERAGAAGPVSAVGYRIVIRAAPEGSSARPRPTQRFRSGTRIFLIQAVAERGGDGLYLTCFADEEGVA